MASSHASENTNLEGVAGGVGENPIPLQENILQKHAAFFDKNHDGVIYPWETFQAIPYGNLNTNPNLSQSAPPDLEISALSSACSDSETKKLQNETESPPKEPNREQPNHDALRKGKNENLLHLLCYKVLKAKAKGENKFGKELKLNPTTTLSK
ncbi:hypothetical protein JHK87_024842 [Glycine soja]|nr:hypothetical protein JHK87_024842 [Glycine soja]